MMETIKLGSKGQSVKTLQRILGLKADGDFGYATYSKVKEFQTKHNLTNDGIVGPSTWRTLISYTSDIYIIGAYHIGCEEAALRAVKEVETGSYKAFIAPNKPPILFEGHIFWSELKKRNIDPTKYASKYPTILYQKWTKSYYKSGLKEYERLETAMKINKEAALASASWGMFQIMGNNYKACRCKSVSEFVDRMTVSEYEQMSLFVNFINSNKNLKNAIINKQWATFARYYNGSGYAQNKYDIKLAQAYKKYC